MVTFLYLDDIAYKGDFTVYDYTSFIIRLEQVVFEEV